MRNRGKYIVVAVLAGAVLAGAPATAAAAEGCQWRQTTLPVPDAYGLDRLGAGDGAGAVAGTLWPDALGEPRVGAVWRADSVQVLGTAFGLDTELVDVNAAGVAVGSYMDPREFGEFPLNHAVRYTGGRFERLPEPPGYTNSKAWRVNARGDVVGFVGETAANGVHRLVRWPAAAPGTVELVPVPSQEYEVAGDIDDEGTIAAAFAFWSTGGGLAGYLLPETGDPVSLTSPISTGDVVPKAVNADHVAGNAGDGGAAYLWRHDGSVERALPGLRYPAAMNAAGDVVGSGPYGETVLAPADGGPTQVVVLGGQDVQVSDVTENGDVLGSATVYAPERTKAPVRWHCS